MALVSDEVQTIPTVIPEVIQRSSTCSLTTLRGFLSSRKPTNFECRNLSASVHSRNSICATASGLNQTAFFIFLALSSSPNLDRLVSGKFTNGQVGVTRCFNFENTCRREDGTNPFRVLSTYISLSPS